MVSLINTIYSHTILALVALVLFGITDKVRAASVKKDDPAFFSVGIGKYDFNRKKETGTEFRLEYRSEKKISIFKPFIAISATNTSQGFVGAGILLDAFVGRRVVITPSFSPNFYWGGNSKLDLDHVLEFRSQLEFAYRFDNRSRMGIAISHYSNASLGDTNPGTETATIYLSLPLH